MCAGASVIAVTVYDKILTMTELFTKKMFAQ